jgi:hypothetical protein
MLKRSNINELKRAKFGRGAKKLWLLRANDAVEPVRAAG